jgi:hypothetical protein
MSGIKIVVLGSNGRDLTPHDSTDFLGFEHAVAALLAREKIHVRARGGAWADEDVPGLHASIQVTTDPDPAEPGANDTGAVITWDSLQQAHEADAEAMLRVLQQAMALAAAANKHIRTSWFLDRAIMRAGS